MNFCTIADKKYMLKALTMFYSLSLQVSPKLKLHWLCLDQESYDHLKELQKSDNPLHSMFRYCVKLYLLSDLEEAQSELVKAKDNPATKYGDQYSNYCWCLTPYFTNWILTRIIPADEFLMYVDSDIYFYHSPQIILDNIGEKSVGIHTHRFGGVYDDNIDVGWFNVGVVVFRKDTIGVAVSDFWKKCMLDSKNMYYEKYGTCGDQKYLNLFLKLWGKADICVFDEEYKEVRCGHLAPWNCANLYHPTKHYIQNLKTGHHEPVVFYHFSHFTTDEGCNEWKDSINGEWNPTSDFNIKKYYEDYFHVMQLAKDYL